MNIEIKENIISGSIIYNLKQTFGDSYKYYDDTLEENFIRPSFHVSRIDNILKKGYTGNAYKAEDNAYRYLIKYFPAERITNMEDINNKIDELKQLFRYLNIINIDGENVYSKPNRINEIIYTTSEGVLLFELQFNIRTMQYLEIDKVQANVLTETVK